MMERIRDLLAVHYKNKKSIDFSMLFHSAESEALSPEPSQRIKKY